MTYKNNVKYQAWNDNNKHQQPENNQIRSGIRNQKIKEISENVKRKPGENRPAVNGGEEKNDSVNGKCQSASESKIMKSIGEMKKATIILWNVTNIAISRNKNMSVKLMKRHQNVWNSENIGMLDKRDDMAAWQ